eukprot:5265783-Prymnesium_polylepis.1
MAAVRPCSFLSIRSIPPVASSTLTASSCRLKTAQCSAVFFVALMALMSAPASSSARMASTWPLAAAIISAVLSLASRPSTGAPAARAAVSSSMSPARPP